MEVLCIIATALVLASGFYFGYILGKTGEFPKGKEKEEKPVQKKEDDEDKDRRFEIALANLDRYDGTDKGQEEIE